MKSLFATCFRAALIAVFGGLFPAAVVQAQPAQSGVPDFWGLWQHGPVAIFIPVEGKPNGVQLLGVEPGARVPNDYPLKGIYDNPVLRPHAQAKVKAQSDSQGTEHTIPTPQEICYPSGVPNVATLPAAVQFLQTPDKITILYQRDHQARQIFLNVPHSERLTPTWYGESVGRYEGADTLVVDTIGLNDKTPVDIFGTPHSEQLHVVERFKLINGANGGRSIELEITVEDPATFTTPWSGKIVYNWVNDIMGEEVCAENNRDIFGGDYPVPTQK